jgi:UDP-2,4-diacetamido-2,4,6-trideoxy-beta-L-altropyranose hydrolase
VDHYALDTRWESELRRTVRRILVIDDLADRMHNCDVLLDQNLYEEMDTRYTGKVPAHCQLLLGPRYALLREEFSRLRQQVKPRTGTDRRVLVFFGGVDAENYTSPAIEALVNISIPNLHVDVVIGTQHPDRHQVESECTARGFAFHVQTSQMAELMVAANLAIGAGGSTSWERCCLGLPSLVFAVADNQEQTSRALADFGAAYLGRNEIFAAEIERVVKYLFVPTRLHEMSVKAAELVDGQGAIRLSDVLFREVHQ